MVEKLTDNIEFTTVNVNDLFHSLTKLSALWSFQVIKLCKCCPVLFLQVVNVDLNDVIPMHLISNGVKWESVKVKTNWFHFVISLLTFYNFFNS